MSRVYEALRQSELERGTPGTLLDPDAFVPHPEPTDALPSLDMDALAWDKIVSFQPMPKAESRLVTFTDDNGLGAEKFRLLRTRLRHIQEQKQVRKIVITSAVPDEGKTLVSMNLAISLSKHTTQKVLLLEGDFRKPMLATHLGMTGFRGLDNWFTGSESISNFVYQVKDLQLWVLPAGVPRDNPLAILQSARFMELYQRLSKCFDWVLVDAPPIVPMADVNFWSRLADGVLLVSREGKTPKKLLQRGLEVLDNPKLIGIVLNEAHGVERSYYKQYYGADKQSHK